MTHSHGIMLCAVGSGRRLGIDIELMRRNVAYDDVAESFFSTREAAVLASLPSDQKRGAFFTIWTRKEAYVKACGQGLAVPLDSFDVPIFDHEPLRLESAVRPNDVANWSLHRLDVDVGYAAALVVEGRGVSVRCFAWLGEPHSEALRRVRTEHL